MVIRRTAFALAVLAPLLSVYPQQVRKPDDATVEAAIRRGATWLKQSGIRVGQGGQMLELVLLALVHSGIRTTDPVFASLLDEMLEAELKNTYRVSLQAMVLEELDRVKYQKRIYQCAQFLVDNQAANGQWSYGQATTYPEITSGGTKDVATGPATIRPGQVVMFGDAESQEKPAVRNRIPVRKQRDGGRGGDNSNSQYAALGLRACHDSGIVFPREVVEKAHKWWKASQCEFIPGATFAKGWSYASGGNAYGSMTAGAVGALSICDYILGIDWKKDETLNMGVTWLKDSFSVTENPGMKGGHHYYYLYGLERAGMLYGTDTFGKHDWYAEGAQFLLEHQAPTGQWNGAVDTCFAILFLRRATRALVESKDNVRPRK